MRLLSAIPFVAIALTSVSCDGLPIRGLMNARTRVVRADTSTGPVIAAQFAARLVTDQAALREVAEAEAEPATVTAVEPDWSEIDKAAPDGDEPDEESDAAALARIEAEANADSAEPRLLSIAKETWIFSQPTRKKSRRIGYLRAGAIVKRSAKPAGTAGCKGGWYRIEPEGYVCLGKSASLDPFHPIARAASVRPKRDGLPYDYVMARTPGPTFYGRVPSSEEQNRAEPDLGYFKKKLTSIAKDPAFVPLPEAGPMPPSLLYGRPLPLLADAPPRSIDQLVVGHAGIRSGFALLGQFEQDDRRFGLTTDLNVIPLDRTRWVKPTTFHGLELGDEVTLPVAFVMKKRATHFAREEGGRMRATDGLSYREIVPLTGVKQGGYAEAKDGTWLKQEDIRTIEPMTRAPVWAKEGKKWIDVSILEQALVAYEGEKPRYVTLVSTGADGLGDPKKTHSTVQGVFLIHTKHVTVTMDGDETGDEFDLRDVPFVQYFTDGYALHAAYWHDDFGVPRSHGCVNLAPVDAAWLFGFTTPDVPDAWHAALSLKRGTVVFTHP